MKKKLLITFTVFAFMIIAFINLKPAPIEAKNTKAKEITNKRADPNTPEPPQTVKEDVWTQERLDEYFSHMGDDNTLVLQLPEGGWIGHVPGTPPNPGVLDIYSYDENGNKVGYDIETDPNSETIAEAKKRLLGTPIDYE